MSTKLKAALASITVNFLLLIAKIIVAVYTGSIGLLAESAHSLFDLVASLLAYLGIRKAEEPSDETHQFGHHKFESLSSFLQALLIAATSIVIMWESYQRFLHPAPVENSWAGIIVMVLTIPVTLFTSRYLSKIAKEAGGSQALEADSAHFTTDVMGSIAVLLGLIMTYFGFNIGDPLAALIVGIIMLYIAIHLIIDAFRAFMDYSPDKNTLAKIKKMIISDKRVKSFHNLKARSVGSHIFIEFHIRVDKNMRVKEAHKISHILKDKIIRKIPQIQHCTIHIEPD